MRITRITWMPVLLVIITVIITVLLLPRHKTIVQDYHPAYTEKEEWQPPDEKEIPSNEEGELIRYGKLLITNTSYYLGPKGLVASLTNGMNCQNCHLEAGGRLLANPFCSVASTYPRYRDRSGRKESIEFRINDCLLRSLNGQVLDSQSREMRAMVAFLKWVGKDVPKGVKPKGSGTINPVFLDRAADPAKGKSVYLTKCQRCHGPDGTGVYNQDSSGYVYPPLWGDNSYNVSAGIFQLSRLAGFIKNNMPFGTTTWKNPQLTDEEAWDVAAYINSQPRPQKFFHADWPDRSKKPFDYPFGPYTDSFSEVQHKYGPFEPIRGVGNSK